MDMTQTTATAAPGPALPRGGLFADLPLRFKLMLMFLILSALSSMAVALFSDRTSSQELTSSAGETLHTTATQAGISVGNLLNRQIGLMQSFALSQVVQDGAAKANASYAAGTNIQATVEALDKQWIAAKDTDALIQDHLTNQVAGELQEFRSTFPDNVEVFVTDKYGALLASTNRTSDYYQADEDWWQKAFNNGQGAVYIGQPTYDESARTLALTIAVPLHSNTSKDVIGVLRSTYRLDALVKQVTSANIGATGRTELFLTEAQYLTADQKVADFDPATLSQILTSAASYMEMSYLNIPSLVSHAPVRTITDDQAIANLGWSIVVHQARDESLQVVSSTEQTILLTGLGTLFVSGVLALVLAQLLSSPIGKLTEAARAIAAGNLGQRLRLRRRDEIGALGASFDSMADALEARIAAEQEARTEAERLQQAETENRQLLERAVGEYLAFVQNVARGDLTQRLRASYDGALEQLAEGLNSMVSNLHQITGQVQAGTNAIAAAVAQISAATTEQAASSAEQSAAITETATAVEEVKTIALQTANQANQVAESSLSALNVAHEGNEMVAETISSMSMIRQQVGQIATTLGTLSEQTRSIGTLIASVSELADQINNLGQNAAIEATRSDQQDKDLEGLARLVRDLANKAKGATGQVRQILSEIQRVSKAAVDVTEEGTRRAESGARLVSQTGQVIKEMANEVEKGAQANVQMAAAAHQQMLGMEQIGQAMVAIQQATAQTLVGTRQAEQAAQDLQNLARSLQDAIAVYQL